MNAEEWSQLNTRDKTLQTALALIVKANGYVEEAPGTFVMRDDKGEILTVVML